MSEFLFIIILKTKVKKKKKSPAEWAHQLLIGEIEAFLGHAFHFSYRLNGGNCLLSLWLMLMLLFCCYLLWWHLC